MIDIDRNENEKRGESLFSSKEMDDDLQHLSAEKEHNELRPRRRKTTVIVGGCELVG